MIRLAVRCAPRSAQRVLDELLVLAPGGVEEEHGPGWVEYAIYGTPDEVPDLGELRAAAGEELVEVSSAEVPDDWADRWRDFHQPTRIAGARLEVRPSWLDPGDPASLEVVVDPGRAFGTGAHATTRMCLELLLELADSGGAGALADLGTGSGVIAIAAAKLGFAPVFAVDHEPAALEAAGANASRNEVEIELKRLDLRAAPPPPAGTVVANLTAPLLRELAPRLRQAGATRALVCSGLLAGEEDEVSAAFGAAGLAATRRLASGDWVALFCQRRSDGDAG